MTDITARLPAALSSRISSTANAIATRSGRGIDHAIGGIPFISAASPNNPFIIETAQMNKQQTDQEPEPGEQSLQGWWIRSQDSWHDGAGALYQEQREASSALRVGVSNRFYTSSGIDVWTEGELKLLKETIETTGANTQAACLYNNTDYTFLGVGASVYRTSIGGVPTVMGTFAGENVTDVCAGKAYWYAVTDAGTVYTDAVTPSALKNFPLTNADTVFYGDPKIAWAKHRLFAVYGRRVYVVDTTGAAGTAQTAIYSHPTTDWTYTDIAEGPACVYLAGYSDAESCIQKIAILDDGTTPTLTAGVTTAILPPGERVERIAVLAGTWIGIATNRGFRMGTIDANGDIQYGPLFLTPDNLVSVGGIATWDRFFYVSFRTSDSTALCYRVDSSAASDDGSFAYAADAEYSGAGYFTDLAVTVDGRVVAAYASGLYPSEAADKYCYQHASNLVSSGSITMGRIRFRTTEPKVFKYLSLDVDPLAGTIVVDAVLPNNSTSRVRVYNTAGSSELDQATLSSQLGPLRSMGLTFTLQRSGTDSTAGPVLHSYSVKAMPAVKPQRLITLPLSCFDREAWASGQEDGADGWARDRLEALQEIEDGGDIILWQDFGQENASGRQVKIENVRFIQTAPPHSAGLERNYGGVIQLTLRTMD